MKLFKLILITALLPLLIGACDALERDSRKFGDDPKLEFAPLSETADEGEGTVTTEIQLIGSQRSSDLPVSFSVDDSSTAEQGTHFNLGSTSATISSNSSQTPVNIEVLDNDVDDGDTNYVLYLSLENAQEVEPAENLKTFTLTIRGEDEN